jgi:hypothetical protein
VNAAAALLRSDRSSNNDGQRRGARLGVDLLGPGADRHRQLPIGLVGGRAAPVPFGPGVRVIRQQPFLERVVGGGPAVQVVAAGQVPASGPSGSGVQVTGSRSPVCRSRLRACTSSCQPGPRRASAHWSARRGTARRSRRPRHRPCVPSSRDRAAVSSCRSHIPSKRLVFDLDHSPIAYQSQSRSSAQVTRCKAAREAKPFAQGQTPPRPPLTNDHGYAAARR